MNRIVVVQHGNIALVTPELSDIELIGPEMNSIETTQFLDQDDFEWSVMPRLRDEKSFAEKISKHGHFMCIYKADTKEVVGTITLHSVSERNRHATPGIVVFSKYQNQGIGTQAMRLILRYGFEFQGFHKINLYVWTNNIGGIKCYKKSGFKQIGIHREHIWNFDKYEDMVDMEILVDEYKELKKEWFA